MTSTYGNIKSEPMARVELHLLLVVVIINWLKRWQILHKVLQQNI